MTCFKSLEDLYPPLSTVFMVGNPYYAAMGEVGSLQFLTSKTLNLITARATAFSSLVAPSKQVQDSSDVTKDGRVRVVFNLPHEPQLELLIQNQHVRRTYAHPLRACLQMLFLKGFVFWM